MSLLVNRCTIERNTVTNTDGEIKPSWANVATGVSCLLQEGRGRVRLGEGGQYLEYDAILFVGPTQDIKPDGNDDRKDRVTMTKPTRLNGAKFLVEHVADESGMEDHLTCFLKRVSAK